MKEPTDLRGLLEIEDRTCVFFFSDTTFLIDAERGEAALDDAIDDDDDVPLQP